MYYGNEFVVCSVGGWLDVCVVRGEIVAEQVVRMSNTELANEQTRVQAAAIEREKVRQRVVTLCSWCLWLSRHTVRHAGMHGVTAAKGREPPSRRHGPDSFQGSSD